MKVLIINAYDRSSKGDAMLLSQTIKMIRLAFPQATFFISSMEDPDEFPLFESYPNVSSFRLEGDAPHLFKPFRMFYKLRLIVAALLWARLNTGQRARASFLLPKRVRGLCEHYRQSDLVVSVAGGYLNAKRGLGGDFNIFFHMHPIRVAENLKKPVILLNQTIGPFGSRLQKRIAKWGLRDTRLIITREKISYDTLREIGIPASKIHASIDLGFLAETDRKTPKKVVRVKKVGVTASVRLKQAAQLQYEDAFSQFMNAAAAKNGINFVGLPQSTSTYQNDGDQAIYGRLLRQTKQGAFSVEERPLDHRRIVKEYGRYDLTVGTRFHSVIFSLINFVPSIAVEYDYKTTGIMRDLGLEKWVITVEDVTAERLMRLFEDLCADYENYTATLQQKLPAYIRRSSTLPGLIRRAYQQEDKSH